MHIFPLTREDFIFIVLDGRCVFPCSGVCHHCNVTVLCYLYLGWQESLLIAQGISTILSYNIVYYKKHPDKVIQNKNMGSATLVRHSEMKELLVKGVSPKRHGDELGEFVGGFSVFRAWWWWGLVTWRYRYRVVCGERLCDKTQTL